MEQKLKIGIIGAGNIGNTLGTLWEKAGYPLCYALRNEERQHDYKTKYPQRIVMSYEQAATTADVLLLAIRYEFLEECLFRIGQHLKDKIVLDCTNPYIPNDKGEDNLGKSVRAIAENVSAGELLAGKLTGTAIVKVFCNLSNEDLQRCAFHHPLMAMPYALTDKSKQPAIHQLIKDTGYHPFAIGNIAQAKRIELFGDLSIHPFSEEEILTRL